MESVRNYFVGEGFKAGAHLACTGRAHNKYTKFAHGDGGLGGGIELIDLVL